MSEDNKGPGFDMSSLTPESIRIFTEYQKVVNETAILNARLAIENTPVARVLKTINHVLVFSAGALLAVLAGCASISGIIWLLAQVRNITWGM